VGDFGDFQHQYTFVSTIHFGAYCIEYLRAIETKHNKLQVEYGMASRVHNLNKSDRLDKCIKET
jgi:hypothetical protein